MTSTIDINNKFVSPEFNETDYHQHKFFIELFNSIQMRGCESYINGLELPDFLLKSTLNTILPICYQKYPFLLIAYEWLLKESEYLAESSDELMEKQYNLPKELFTTMLGESTLMYPKYTMALWEKGATNLEQAQIDMLDDLIIKADIKDGDHILDIGCGFGSALHYILSKFPNSQVTGLNLSKQHCQYIRTKIKDAQSYFSSDHFTLVEGDFNTINFEQKFDKIISLGVFEHVGNLTNSFKKVSSLLKDKGQFFLHIITIKFPHSASSVFLEKYIFPRFRVWGYENVPLYNQNLKTVNKWFMNGSNYSQTLTAWLRNFDDNQEYLKTLDYGMEYNRFRRMWRLYLMWCIAYFDACNGEVLGNGQYLMTKA
ncbi:Methyltransferase type 12 [Cyanobacterium stanieri PCC 7202]|uniref:Methyltransferase type 12 n=1 Tax=Cyanobacterium stanieri (strain ATCC 29140 / PCC 7202) TaxID=292563 RepID=K9YKV0_CYASC|nr:Methyltransferase type 12 [Cyanobacterium stanieri PCC 7202]